MLMSHKPRAKFWCLAVVASVLALAETSFSAKPAPKPDERVTLYPALGWRGSNGWEIELAACIYEPENRAVTLPLLKRALGLDDVPLTPSEAAFYRERARLLLVDHQGGRAVQVRLATATGQSTAASLGLSAGDGVVRGILGWPDAGSGLAPGTDQTLSAQALPPEGSTAVLATNTAFLLAPTGLSVISDLDDTIKISLVRQRHELLRNTFCRAFQPVPGMADLYQRWARTNAARFHYVSASPRQLYPVLAEFARTNGFPAGTWHLRPLYLKPGVFFDLQEAPERYKRSEIEPLLARFPQRRFVLVGDSGERDPEIYAALAREHPGQIAAIFIRDVTGENASSTRMQSVFAGLATNRWSVFTSPASLSLPLP